jgi:predicted O-methyltransferase YrrM
MKNTLRKFFSQLPYVRGLKMQVDAYKKNACYPPGHFYSALVSVDDIRQREAEIWKEEKQDQLSGLDLNVAGQITLVKLFETYYKELPFAKQQKEGFRFYFDNPYYCETDSIILYSYIRHFKPKRIIEIGSGFSSAVMLDTRERFAEGEMELTFIEPYPERLLSLINEKDRKSTKIIEKPVQSVDLSLFGQLEKNDILFVDSTHVSKAGSDVNFILFQILPLLKKGVLVHFHDVFYPFEYPREWVLIISCVHF